MSRAALRGFIAASLVAATFAVASPARADNVTVRFGISAGHYAPAASCPLSVPQGTTGIGVLNAAVAAGCIQGYQMDGAWLRCVTLVGQSLCSDVHEDPFCCATHYWALYEDAGAVAPHPVGDFRAGVTTHNRLVGNVPVAHTELALSWESWVKCLGWPVFCNPDL